MYKLIPIFQIPQADSFLQWLLWFPQKKAKEIWKFLNNTATSTLWSAQENTALKSQSRNSARCTTEKGEEAMNPIHCHLPLM